MTEAEKVKWALLDLIKFLDGLYGADIHDEFSRIAKTLGVELPKPVVSDDEDEV